MSTSYAPPPVHPTHFIPKAGPRACNDPSRRTREQVLNNVPDVFGSVAELAAGNASRETVVADGNLLVYVFVGEVVGTLGHGTDKDTNALL